MARVTIQGGWAAFDAARLLAVFGPGLDAAAAVVAQAVSGASPVLTGALRDDWLTPGRIPPPDWSTATTISTEADNFMVYAHYQNVSTRNAGYADQGVAEAEAPAVQALADDAAARLGELWENSR